MGDRIWNVPLVLKQIRAASCFLDGIASIEMAQVLLHGLSPPYFRKTMKDWLEIPFIT
jgi:hypothetical protein